MATADPAHCADDCRELANARQQPSGSTSFAPRLLTISVVTCAIGLAGCARNPTQGDLKPVQHVAKAAPVCPPARTRIYTAVRRQAEPRVHRPDAALLEPQLAPSCEFKRAEIKAVDPDEWARLKTEYERQCFQDAERLARARLSQLQDAIR